jgi:hypothetical protein
MSVASKTRIHDILSVRSYTRCGSKVSVMGGNFQMHNALIEASTVSTQGRLNFYPNKYSSSITKGSLRLTADTGGTFGGVLHGTWTQDNNLVSSDRRLKMAIAPLYKKLVNANNRVSDDELNLLRKKEGAELAMTEEENTDGVMTVLRELRPVSFKYKKNAEAKYSRYGFIAQELEKLLPDVVYEDSTEGYKYVQYQDLIAVITLGLQTLDTRLLEMDKEVTVAEDRIDDNFADLRERMFELKDVVKKVVQNTKVKVNLTGDEGVVHLGSTTHRNVTAILLDAQHHLENDLADAGVLVNDLLIETAHEKNATNSTMDLSSATLSTLDEGAYDFDPDEE